MERLTEVNKDGKWRLKGLLWSDTETGKIITQNTNEKIYGALCKLRDYENTGITPDQLQVINEEYQKMAKELAELRKQNSKNPYKVGDTVYCIEKYEDGYDYSGYRYIGQFGLCEEHIVACPTYMWRDDFNDQLREMATENTDDARGDIYLFNGMNVYRTKEEAKAAVARLEEE